MRSSSYFACGCRRIGGSPQVIDCSQTEYLTQVREIVAKLVAPIADASLSVLHHDEVPADVPFSPCLLVRYTWETGLGDSEERKVLHNCIACVLSVKRGPPIVPGFTVRTWFRDMQMEKILYVRPVPKTLSLKPAVVLPARYSPPMVFTTTQMSAIFCCERVATGEPVVVKMPFYGNALERETYFSTSLAGVPHLVQTTEIVSVRWRGEERLGIVLDRYDGDMDMMVLSSSARAAAFLRDMLEALAVLHHRGIVHRDIKPANIFMNLALGRGVADVALGDLATMRYLEERTPEDDALSEVPTSLRNPAWTRGCRGTYLYQPPECLGGSAERKLPKADVWSLGATAIVVHTTLHPFLTEKDVLWCCKWPNDCAHFVLNRMKWPNEGGDQLAAVTKKMDEIGTDAELKKLMLDMVSMSQEDRPTAGEALARCESICDRLPDE